MTCTTWWKHVTLLLLAALVPALAAPQPALAQGKAEDELRQAFGQLQGAIKAKDAAKIWPLLDTDTQADAAKVAKKLKATYLKADDKEKAERQTNLGLTADEFAKLDGTMLLKTKRFLGKYDEIPDSKITGVTVQADSAVVNYLEPDGDKEKLTYTRQDGKWKAAMPLPKFTK
jgi:hypothetical protein